MHRQNKLVVVFVAVIIVVRFLPARPTGSERQTQPIDATK